MSGEQSYYVPEQSKLAICMATAVAFAIVGVGGGINGLSQEGGSSLSWYIFFAGLLGIVTTMFFWFKQTIQENLAGMNSPQLNKSYVLGMLWFIGSEVFFFICFFGVLFYVRNLAGPWLAGDTPESAVNTLLWEGFEYNWPMMETPQQAVGGVGQQLIANSGEFSGPDKNMAFPGFSDFNELLKWIPLWNTILLLSSSVTVHIAHGALKDNNRKGFNTWLAITLILGFAFVALQIFEYYEAYAIYGLTLGSGIYGSTFFILTGFHGFHVCMGAIMLSVQWLRSVGKGHFTHEDQFGFEASSWYWHFVDVVWVFLVLFVYVI